MRIPQERGKSLISNFNKSALTDHATIVNHITDREEAKIIDKKAKQKNLAINGSHLDQKDEDTAKETRTITS